VLVSPETDETLRDSDGEFDDSLAADYNADWDESNEGETANSKASVSEDEAGEIEGAEDESEDPDIFSESRCSSESYVTLTKLQLEVSQGNKKRQGNPTASAETTRIAKKAKGTTGSQKSSRVATRDFNPLTQTVIAGAQHYYRCLISAENPYPTNAEEVNWAGMCWRGACQDKGVDIEFDNDFRKLVCCTQLSP
jgi:hypothetical protein